MRIKSVVFTALILAVFAAGAWAQTFTDVTVTANIGGISGTSAAWGDYNNDGYPDLYVSDITTANGLYRNTHSEFDLIGMSQSAGGTVSWADYDNDQYFGLANKRRGSTGCSVYEPQFRRSC